MYFVLAMFIVRPNLGTCDLYLPKLEETLKYTSQGRVSNKDNRCSKWDMVVKGHNKKPEKYDP